MKKRKNKLNNFVIIGILYFIILLTISTAYSFFNTDLSIKATTGIANDKYNSDYILIASWNNGNDGPYFYHYTVNFTYTDIEPTIAWKYYIEVPYDTEVIGCYSSDSCTVEGEILTITNDINNRSLSPTNQTASFGFQIKTNTKDYQFKTIGAYFVTDNTNDFYEDKTTYNKNNKSYNTNEFQTVDYIKPVLNITGGWGNTSTYIFNVSNISDIKTINSWSARLKFPSGSSVNSLWGGEYEFNSETGELTLHQPAWSPTLKPLSKTEINIYITTPLQSPYIPEIIGFNGVTTNEENIKTDITIQGG